MFTGSPLYVVLNVLLIIPAIILHEVSHGYVAYLLGDPTAHDRGRLTLNPIAHVDLWGTIAMPAIMLLLSGGTFALGYAKPVPIDPRRMWRTTMQTGMLLTGAAGPATNLVLAVIAGLGFRVVALLGAPAVVQYVFAFFCLINLVLAFFNLIPIPPLDGSRVVQRFLKGEALRVYGSLEPYGFFIVLGLLFLAPGVIQTYFNFTVRPISTLLLGGSLI
jgi:Zn-dependent protease